MGLGWGGSSRSSGSSHPPKLLEVETERGMVMVMGLVLERIGRRKLALGLGFLVENGLRLVEKGRELVERRRSME